MRIRLQSLFYRETDLVNDFSCLHHIILCAVHDHCLARQIHGIPDRCFRQCVVDLCCTMLTRHIFNQNNGLHVSSPRCICYPL